MRVCVPFPPTPAPWYASPPSSRRLHGDTTSVPRVLAQGGRQHRFIDLCGQFSAVLSAVHLVVMFPAELFFKVHLVFTDGEVTILRAPFVPGGQWLQRLRGPPSRLLASFGCQGFRGSRHGHYLRFKYVLPFVHCFRNQFVADTKVAKARSIRWLQPNKRSRTSRGRT